MQDDTNLAGIQDSNPWQKDVSGLGAPPEPSTTTDNSVDPSTTMPVDPNPTSVISNQPDNVSSSPDELIDIKTQALNQLTPIVGHLDQTPEEKFKTTMMMIQASDNKDLIKDAYAAAQQITDEKIKAQALLDVVNEINYFTNKTTS